MNQGRSEPPSGAAKILQNYSIGAIPAFQKQKCCKCTSIFPLIVWSGIEWTKILYFRRNRTEKPLYSGKML
ncbi:hypothetical protein [Paenibacillus dendritiformis]|uniref:hypothetical protein n=1 Tax=Paenibacillus dendritiformis TaxID=130049 RepID=UPI0018CF37A2|nr:hypothetical protein [Paenibacillus dendritiformis]